MSHADGNSLYNSCSLYLPSEEKVAILLGALTSDHYLQYVFYVSNPHLITHNFQLRMVRLDQNTFELCSSYPESDLLHEIDRMPENIEKEDFVILKTGVGAHSLA